ncbi:MULTISPECIES: hypothetical protein [unclassified Sphingomonas]|uniref:hypothetical protein n=1 Tax=unclassified Sphingomonas TaxID=196159 RepID=UPI0016177768|nr:MULTISPECIES: hypothetical protein [unclassified Sphingomonas]MBB3346320.1 hypothetical protein [Sphingomonas sp. BK069]MBB3473369.1 hypothetical protein [Sphingomonas sp. BK345]
MDRRLVLTNEGARHPFRRSLPPPPPLVAAPPSRTREDAKLFLLSFSAFFTCFYTLIA